MAHGGRDLAVQRHCVLQNAERLVQRGSMQQRLQDMLGLSFVLETIGGCCQRCCSLFSAA